MLSRVIQALPFSILVFFISHFLPLSSKTTNNLFYVGIALPGLVFLLLQTKETTKTLVRKLLLPLLLLAFIIASSAESIGDMKLVIYLFLFAVALNASKNDKNFAQKGMWLASLASIAVLIAITLHWVLLSIQSGASIRYGQLMGMEINPVHLALLMATSVGYLWIFHLDSRLQQRGTLAFSMGLSIFVATALLITLIFQARSALVGLGLFFAAYIYQRKNSPWLISGLIGAVIIAIFSLGADDILANRGLSYRPLIWEDALRRLMDDCDILWGCGKDDYLFAGQFPHPHSGYVSVFYQSGALGALAFIIFAGIFFFKSLRDGCRWLPIALIGWGALLTTSNGMFTSPSHPLWIYFWLPTIMCLIESRRSTSALPIR